MSARTSAHSVRWLLIGGMALTIGACNSESGTTPSDPAATVAPETSQATASATLVRLTNSEYDRAVQELLGVPGIAASTLPTDTTGQVGDDGFAQYFDAADALGEQVWSNAFLKARLLSCTPSDDSACTRQLVTSIASRAWHGPMAPSDVDRLTKVAMDAVALGESPTDSIKQVVKTVLASPQFLYQVAPSQSL
jgi:hypothetical protein